MRPKVVEDGARAEAGAGVGAAFAEDGIGTEEAGTAPSEEDAEALA